MGRAHLQTAAAGFGEAANLIGFSEDGSQFYTAISAATPGVITTACALGMPGLLLLRKDFPQRPCMTFRTRRLRHLSYEPRPKAPSLWVRTATTRCPSGTDAPAKSWERCAPCRKASGWSLHPRGCSTDLRGLGRRLRGAILPTESAPSRARSSSMNSIGLDCSPSYSRGANRRRRAPSHRWIAASPRSPSPPHLPSPPNGP